MEHLMGLVAAPIIATIALAVIFGTIAFIRGFLHICEPNEILIFSGRKHQGPDGRTLGYRVITGGRAFRIPVLERVDQMDMTLISVPMTVSGAYSEGGIPLAVSAIANVKVSSDRLVMNNAIERFLGKERGEIGRVAKETLEGHLRGVLATMTPEEVNEDRLKFADQLTSEAGPDLSKLGLQLDTLKVQHVADDRSYLDSIGRTRIAEIKRTAEVAESDAIRSAEEAEAEASARGEVAKSRAQAVVQQKQNALRQLEAELDAEAKSEEERAEQAALAARADAEKELQTLRSDLERLRLAADVTIPAEVERRVCEIIAEGEAAAIKAKGEAVAASLDHVRKAWQECGDEAMDMILVQQIDKIFERVTDAASAVHAKKVVLLDSGDGSTISGYVDSYPAAVTALLSRVNETFGVDVRGVLRGDAPTHAVRRGTTPPEARPTRPDHQADEVEAA
ncbi:MAG: flotillin family protein [Deltaproteobacteria bacterium]|nr:flotillin family protein [Deltaproteobacteria bacterium]